MLRVGSTLLNLERAVTVLALLLLGLAASEAKAIPIVTVDLDPNLAGIQTTGTAQVGTRFAVDVRISQVPTAGALVAYEFDLRFDPTRMKAVQVDNGDFLSNPFSLQTDLNPPDVSVARLEQGAAVAGQGLLARIWFDGLAAGAIDLGLRNVVLSTAGGAASAVNVELDRTLTLVPEPSMLVGLAALGLSTLMRGRQR